jgi:hypothetical protein
VVNIGLDFDDTFTSDPVLWGEFVKAAQLRGHVVFVTTARHLHDLEEVNKALPDLEIIASAGKPKAWAAKQAGVSIDIWIDDMPEIIME